MKQDRKVWCGLVVALLVGGWALQAGAAEEGGGAAEQGTGLAFKWVHFLIVVGALVYVIRKYGRPFFRAKADSISAAIGRASAAKAEAERLLAEAAAKLASLDQEVAAFRAMAHQEAAAELERLRAMTKIDAEKIASAAQAEIAAAERAARVELKALAAKLAVDRAQSLVAEALTPAVQKAMLDHFVEGLAGRPN